MYVCTGGPSQNPSIHPVRHSLMFLPTVTGGGTVGLQMDFSSSSSPLPPSHLQLLDAKTTCPCVLGGGVGGGGGVTVL